MFVDKELSDAEMNALAAWRIANIHHPFVTSHGVECMCGDKPGTRRGFTEHVIEMYQREFDNA